MASSVVASSKSDEIFSLIRGQEANFPFPVKKKTVTIGTFDCASGAFTYSVPTFKEQVGGDDGGPGPLKPPKTIIGGKVNAINAIEVILRFKLKNRTGEVSLSVLGLPVVRTSTGTTISISVGAAESVNFTLVRGPKKFTSALPLEIVRFVAGAGVFELPSFPIAIIYAPVPDQGKHNVSKWTVTKSTGNTTSFSIGKQTTTSKPVTPDFDNVNFFANEMKGFTKALELVNKEFKDPVVSGIVEALGAIVGALGTASATDSEGLSVTNEHSVTVSIAKEQTISTNAASGGPGSGDLIYYLKNVKLAWFTSKVGRIRVTVIGHDGVGVTSMGFLKSGGQSDLNAETVAEYLKLDPFVDGGPSVVLPTDRFVYVDTIDLNGGQISQTETYSITTQDSRQSKSTRTHVQNNKPGLLHFLGLGVTGETSTETVVTHSSAVQNTDSRTISNTLELAAGPTERYAVEVYCDVVFGTFAYRQAGSLSEPILEGEIRRAGGLAAGSQMITLINNGRKFTTKANAAGRYAFHAKSIRPGNSALAVGGLTRKSLMLPAGKTKLDLVI
ncbi:MAG: hypothetical protein HYX27_11530 [Acidobacteria bacterium]|nr:hypothetical protein [Acidobacteriota bacterium]